MATNIERRKELYKLMPEGVIATRQWLLQEGFTPHAIDNLVKSNQMEVVSRGVYVRNSSKITWQSVVYSLQTNLKLDLIVGGLTALEMYGLSHYLSFSNTKTIHLYGSDTLPNWVVNKVRDCNFIKHNAGLLNPKEGNGLNTFVNEKQWSQESLNIFVSTPERAYLEVLLDVPEKTTFEHADQLMQSLTTLSPRTLQKLLEQSDSIKAKRLFFWFADRHNYVWLTKLDREKITLGSGNRMIAKGGKLDRKYKITVPEWL